MGTTFAEATRQSYVVMKNEIKKYFSGKRMMVFAALMGIIVLVITVAPYVFGKETNAVYFLMMSALIVLMAATLFGSISIVSEYEERTALIVFTRPIRKSSIFVGKMLACMVLTFAFMFLYYLIAIAVSVCTHNGSFDGTNEYLLSFGLSCAYAVGCIGIAMLVSSFMKKASTATIITFVIIAVIVSAFSMVLNAANVESSWMIDQASESIQTCSDSFREMTNKSIDSLISFLKNPSNFIHLDKFYQALALYGIDLSGCDPQQFVAIFAGSGAWDMGQIDTGDISVKAPDVLHDTIVMIVWGIVTLIAAFIVFLKREF